jgi:hypothetical protein
MGDHNKRFGKVLAFEDVSGNVHPAAFAALSELIFNAGDAGDQPQLIIRMRIWRDVEAYDAGKAPLQVSESQALKQYILSGQAYEQALALAYNGVPAAKIITDLVWDMVAEIRDVPVDPPSEEKPQGESRSFFKDATAVAAQPEK